MLKTNIRRVFGTLFAVKRVKHLKTKEMEENKNIQEEEIKQQANDCADNAGEESKENTSENTADNTESADAEATADGETTAEAAVDPLEEANRQIEDLKDKYLRSVAEFDNYRKRTLKEKAELILNGGERCITSILPIIDDFERALQTMQSATDVAAVREGVELIYTKFISTLEKNGVKAIETQEKALDTDFHEAIAVIPAPTKELKGKILDCTKKGYTLNDKVIRHAQVVVGE